ncbi:MAG: DUF456 domain-containing protein [Desulfovibrionaceae bacterium]|nr:DUF456 domain-containing protein [Desulfovibrionaceae bacterium]
MDLIWAALFILILFAVLGLHVFTLPANWVILTLLAVWKWLHPEGDMTWTFVGLMAGLAVAGEGLEFASQALGAKKFGASGRGNLGGIIGAVLGAVLGAPLLFGLGAVIGALAGAFAGCLISERVHGRPMDQAWRAAWGSFWGKALGLTVKISLGAVMLALSLPRIWP